MENLITTAHNLRESLQKNPQNEPMLYNLGVISFQLALSQQAGYSLEESRKLLEDATRLNPKRASSWYYIASICENQGNVDDCIEAYENALASDEKSSISLACFNNLVAYGRLDEAAKVSDRAVNAFPDHPAAWTSMAMVLRDNKNLDWAKVCFEKAAVLLKNNPENADASIGATVHNNLAVLSQNLTLAAQHYRTSLSYLPNDMSSLYNLAVLLIGRGEPLDLSEAVELLRRLLTIHEHPQAAFLLSALTSSADFSEAPPEYTRSLFDALAAQEYESDPRSAEQVASMLLRNLPLIQPENDGTTTPAFYNASIIEIGVGTGLLGKKLRKEGALGRLIGCDLSSGMLTIASQLHVDRVAILRKVSDQSQDFSLVSAIVPKNGADPVELKEVYDEVYEGPAAAFLQEMPSHSVDIVVAADTFTYIGDLEDVFAGARKVLREGGVMAFTVDLLDQVEEVTHTLIGAESDEDSTVKEEKLPHSNHTTKVEESDKVRGYKLMPDARFAHSEAYIHKLAVKYGYDVVEKSHFFSRWRGQEAVHDLVVLLEAI
eukprot:scaffold667_cov168-Ochromonas_danica.AAC.15